MKRFLSAIFLLPALVFGATLNPIQLLNPAGSTAGQAVISTGPSSAPAWGTAGAGVYAPLASPTFTGTPLAPTPSNGNNTTQIATTAFVRTLMASPACYGCTAPGTVAATTISATGLITPSTTSGIKGTTLADNAIAGSVGEVVSATFTSVSMTANTPSNLVSISLTAGDWDVTGFASYAAAASTTTSYVICGANTTTATLPAVGQYYQLTATFPVNAVAGCVAPITRINVSSTTTVYLVGQSGFGTSTMTATGFFRARRIR